ncbi:MAG: hypothetical protein GX456_13195 [Verrucomicrobia bacterium]|nr:hypothetical protein [Verrucomicrobiota bacterium]
MRRFVFAICLSVAMAILIAAGCGRGAAPKPVTGSEIPVQLDKLFGKAPEEARLLVGQAKSALRANDLSGAWVALQTLSEQKELTKEQRQFLASAIVTIGAEINKAGEQGDAQAQEMQRMHRLSK